MSAETVHFFYDYVDPASYLVDRQLRRLTEELELRVAPRPFEVRRPPAGLIDARDPGWSRYQVRMEEAAREIGVELRRPRLVPWSRKAHELAFLAREENRFAAVHEALFRAHFVEGLDLGRVDVLVELAAGAGLDRTAVKATLDVDRYAEDLDEERARAERLGVRGVPTLLDRDRRLEGFRRRPEIHTFLTEAPDPE